LNAAGIPKKSKSLKRLSKKALIFRILNQEPSLTARQLQARAEEAGIKLPPLAAYRALRAFRQSGGKLEESDTRCFQLVSAILKEADPGEHLTAAEIKQRALDRNTKLHQATVYRVLLRLVAVGLVLAIDTGRQKGYEWKRDADHHGHLTCIECGKTIEFHQEQLDFLGRQVSSRLGYDFSRIEFVVRSLCDYCRDLL
jgi:Fur family ferric uptake transcriptional regulator